MHSRFASLLFAICLSVTATAAALAAFGAPVGFILAVLCLIATLAWLWAGEVPEAEGLLSLYLALVPLVLLLQTLRYGGGWVAGFGPLVATGSVGPGLTDALWFLVFVCAPVSAAALGGFALAVRHPLGWLMAWWAALWAIAEALLQVALAGAGGWSALDAAGLVVAAALVVVGALLLQRLGAGKARPRPEPALPDPRRRRLWAVLFVALALVYAATLYVEAGLLVVGVIIGSMMGGLIGWWHTTSLRPADPARLLPLLLLMLAFFYVHVGEETLTGFNQAIAALTGNPWPEDRFLLIIALAGPVVWFFAAWSLWKGQAAGNFLLWFLIVGMILGEPAHVLIFPVVVMIEHGGGYAYFSGMYSALVPMIPAILALAEILRTRRKTA
ncbi:hypothetical protein [Amorphus coralli]|uniref:hypothetical protein n=1 Tax=Amorphus coralli TaxID=340680 RepID=UPI00036A0457|nr:hypothetical protein [Amorphus coralli]